MAADHHAAAPLRVGRLADIADGGDGNKPRKAKRRPHAAARAQSGKLVAPARCAHEAVQDGVHHPNDDALTADAAGIHPPATACPCLLAYSDDCGA